MTKPKPGYIQVNGKTYQIVTVDFETFYDKGYTLSGKINTSEYIRDDRFHAHGVGIKIGAGKTLWYTRENIGRALREIDWTKSAMLAHNTPFDGFICSEHYGVIPAFYLDTLAMARACHGHHMRHDLDTIAKAHGFPGKVKRDALADTKGKELLTKQEEMALGGYCVNDVDDTYGIFWKLHDNVPDDELRLIDITTRMFCDPVLRVDMPRVQEELEKEVGGKVAALLKTSACAEDLMSNQKFAQELFKVGAAIPMKVSVSTGKTTYAFAKSDMGFQRLLDDPNPRVAALAHARLKVKSTIGETRAVRFLEAGKDDKCLPVLLNYAGAHTLRWSGGNKMNLQNLKRGGELRRAILAPEGHVVVVADSAQIEARVLAWLAEQLDIVEAFATGQDVYKLMASAIFNVPVDQVDSDQRFLGKVCVLGLGYGMGHAKLHKSLISGAMGKVVEITLAECKRIVDIYRSKNYKIKELWKTMDRILAAMTVGGTGQFGPLEYGKNFIKLPNDMFLQYAGLHGEAQVIHDDLLVTEVTYLTRYGRSKIYGGLLTENVVQALARCIIADQMLAIHDLGYRIVTMTHDEIVVVCPKEQADRCLSDMLKIMATAPHWAGSLPLAAEGGFDENYSK